MGRMVLLRHTLADGTGHYDWMLERGSTLMTWRVDAVPHGEPLFAERLPDHRLAYLSYEGEISEGRGRVDRVRSGEVRVLEDNATRVRWTSKWEGGTWEEWVAEAGDSRWVLARK